MTPYFRGTVDFFNGGNSVRPRSRIFKVYSILFFDVLTPCIGQNLIDFYFFMHENGLFMKEGGQVGNAHIDHIDFAVFFSVSFITYQNRNIVVVFFV